MVREGIFFTFLDNKVTTNTSSSCTLISTLDCSNGVNVFAVSDERFYMYMYVYLCM